MNTAVDEDDDEEEEEELGWDDDEEDLEDDEDEGYDEGDSEEVVEFSGGKDEELEKLMQQLTQATEERDQLHNTVEMQAKEIARLKSGDTSGAVETKEQKALEKLKMELFEKNAELAALKASLEDTHEDSEEGVAKKDSAKLAAQERELKQLRGAAVDKETDISQLKTEISKLTQELDEAVANFEHLHVESESDKKALATVLAEKEELEEQLRAALESNKKALVATSVEKEELETLVKTLQEQLAASRSDLDSLHQAMESSNSKTVSHIMTLQSETVAAKAQVESLTTEVEELKGNLHFTSGRADHLEVELQEAKDALKKQEAEFAMKLADEIAKVHLEHEQLSADSPHSESTGVQIPAPSAAPPLVTKMPSNNGDDEEDWGDDWGDEDE
jgi:predicted  nucleic acid-binding Zn-ribbon protein